ncbi:MAG: ATP-binding protein [Desulfovibrionaceae bacterium]
MDALRAALKENENRLMTGILSHAKAQGYTAYTSTLVEAWRISIQGLSDAIIEAMAAYGGQPPEFHPEDTFEDDPIARFGIVEARRHRQRGISLSMFLGLFKYYRYTYIDLIRTLTTSPEKRLLYETFVERCFDRIEIAFCTQWAGLDADRAIMELQNANRLMTNEKNKYLTLFESLDSPVFLVDEQGLLDNMNSLAATMVGRRGTAGAMYYATGHGGANGRSREPLAALLPWLEAALTRLLHSDEGAFQLEVEMPEDDDRRCILATLSRMRDISGKFSGGVVVLEDVTERKKMERLKEDVASITRHDLKTPLSGMLGVLNYLLNDEMQSPQQRELLTLARNSGYDMLDKINRSLDIFKIEMGIYRFEPVPVDLGMVLRRLLEHLETGATDQAITFAVTIDGIGLDQAAPGPFVQAEEMLLYSAFGNLLTNAMEAAPMGSDVRVEIKTATACRITILNQGGVPEQIRDSFFEKYVTCGKKGGTGLGTYSARLLIQTMNGEVSMASDGQRTEVTVVLRLADT